MERICCGQDYPTVAHACAWCKETVEVGHRVVYVARMETCCETCNDDYHRVQSERADEPCGCGGESFFTEMSPDDPYDAQSRALEDEASEDLTCWCGASDYRVCPCTEVTEDDAVQMS